MVMKHINIPGNENFTGITHQRGGGGSDGPAYLLIGAVATAALTGAYHVGRANAPAHRAPTTQELQAIKCEPATPSYSRGMAERGGK